MLTTGTAFAVSGGWLLHGAAEEGDGAQIALGGALVMGAVISAVFLVGWWSIERFSIDHQTRERQQLVLGLERDLTNRDLSRLNLKGIALGRSADFCGTRFVSSDLSGCSLVSANLAKAELSAANLTRSFLLGANLAGAVLHDADLRQANLANADLSGADLSGAGTRNGSVINYDAKFGAANRWLIAAAGAAVVALPLESELLAGWGGNMRAEKLTLCIFALAAACASMRNFVRAAGHGPNFDGAVLRGANLKGAKLTCAVMTNADLSGANLEGADLTGELSNPEWLAFAATLCGAWAAWMALDALLVVPAPGPSNFITFAVVWSLLAAWPRFAGRSWSSLFKANLEGAVWDESTVWPDGWEVPAISE